MQGTASRRQQSCPSPIDFRRDLLDWFDQQRRDLPWRRTKDPYAIWLSEIMLQQTRVAAALPYYERFLKRFPTYQSLADAPEADVLTHWAGLGYYHRARNLQRAAKELVERGDFPAEYAHIKALPGIGDYTAAAIASIAFDKPHPVVDGNVFRVLSRLHADGTDIGRASARKHFTQLAAEFLDVQRPGDFNQAMMELGATVCLPRNPQCLLCPVRGMCKAQANGTQHDFPVKTVPQKQVSEHRTLLWICRDDHVLAWRREAHLRLMPGFWELPEKTQLPDVNPGPVIATFRHGITFHNYTFDVAEADTPSDTKGCEWVAISVLGQLPISTIFRKAARAVRMP